MANDPFAGLDPGFAAHLKQLMNAAEQAVGSVGITSGARSTAEQAALYKQKPNLAAPPGSSWHEKGLAADLNFGGGNVLAWAHQHAAEYGLFFPMSWEPWHVQPLWTQGRKVSETDTTGLEGMSTPPAGAEATDVPQSDVVGNLLGGLSSRLAAPDGNDLTHPKAEMPWESWGNTVFGKQKQLADTGVVDSNHPVTGSSIDRILAVIRQKESGGNYKANNTAGGARGAYQFIDSTWLGAGGGKFAPRADMATPAQQDEVARQYVQKILDANNGDVRSVPATWYVGHYDPNHLNYVPAPEAGNTQTVQAYTDSWLAMLGQAPSAKQPSHPVETSVT